MGRRRDLRAVGPVQGVETTRIVVPRELRAAGEPLFYGEAGQGAAVLLIHGLGGSSRWWFPIFPALTVSDYRAVAPDLPGFGRSPGPPPPFDAVARRLIELADRLGLTEFFVCGHSLGGAIAVQLAADYADRVRRLVLIDSAGIPDVVGRRVLGRLVRPWSWCPLRFYPTLIGDMMRAGPGSLRAATRHLRQHDIRLNLKRTRAPTLVIWGEKDRLTPLEHGRRIADLLPDARFEITPGIRHLPMVSAPEAVARLMVEFFDESFRVSDDSG